MEAPSSPYPIPEHIIDTYLATFPKTPELFYFGYVIPQCLSRVNAVKWFKDMTTCPLYKEHYALKKFLEYTKILTSSHDNIAYLFKLQAAANLQNGQRVEVVKGNFHYPILYAAHKLWIDFAFELGKIFALININVYEEVLKLLNTEAWSEKGKQIITLICENEIFPILMRLMKENDIKLAEHIRNDETV